MHRVVVWMLLGFVHLHLVVTVCLLTPVATVMFVVAVRWWSRAQRLHRHGHLHGFGVFKLEGQRELVAFFERLLEPHEHDVVPAGFECDILARGEHDRLDRSHLHEPVFHRVAVNLHPRRDRA